jgi:hypothetical protein
MIEDRDDTQFSPAEFIELTLLRVAAMAVDFRSMLSPHEMKNNKRLELVLESCESLFVTLGWGQPKPPSSRH